MKINKYILSLLTATLVCSSLLMGCNQDANETTLTVEEIPIETVEPTLESVLSETSSTEDETLPLNESTIENDSEESNLLLLTITIENSCGADIGMFSVIDPVTKEQVNVDGIKNGESLSIQANWPIGITDFQWAVYNQQGKLYTESTTNFSQAKESVVITLQGEGSIDNIDTTFR